MPLVVKFVKSAYVADIFSHEYQFGYQKLQNSMLIPNLCKSWQKVISIK
jgi:hypothetical protein